MANWDEEHPGRLEGLGGPQGVLSSTETALGDARTAATTAQSGVTATVWTGDAASAWTSSLSSPIGTFDVVVPAMAAVRSAIDTYVSTVDGIRTLADGYTQSIWEANQIINRSFLDPVGGPSALEQHRRDTERQGALGDRTRAQNALDGLSQDRRDADSALVSALTPPGGDTWEQQRAALAAIGVTSAADLTPGNLAKGMADLAVDLGHGNFDPDQAAQLQALYGLYGNDPSIMARMNLELGGEDLISLLGRIDQAGDSGWLSAGAALLLAQSVRGGLSVGSQRWTESVGANFAEGLYAGAADLHNSDSWTTLAFLFGDETGDAIGETVTVALADLADENERGNPGAGYPGPGQGILGPGGFLALAEAEAAGYDANRLGDWTSRVFSTLGEYPEAAYDWLTAGGADPYQDSPQFTDQAGLSEPYADNATLGQNRVEYWFGRRDSHIDGFEGVLALWAGAEHYPGGPYDSSATGGDPAAYTMVANLSHDVITALVGEPREVEGGQFQPGNPHFVSENVSDLGAVKLVEALAPQLPGIVEWPLTGEETGIAAADMPRVNGTYPFGIDPTELGLDPSEFPLYDYVNLSKEQVAQILGIAGQNEAGATALSQVVGDYQDTLAAASQGGLVSAGDAADRITVLQGQLDGATNGTAVGEAGRHDEAVQSALDLVETGVGFLPIPGLDKLVGKTGDAVLDYLAEQAGGYTTGQMVGWAKDLGGAAWGASQDALLGDLAEGELSREQAARIQLAQFVYNLGGVEGVPDPTGLDADELWEWATDDQNVAKFDAVLGDRDLGQFGSRYTDSYGNSYANAQY